MGKTIWITYAWADNEHADVDFVAQELEGLGLTVHVDRWVLGAGVRLWQQIETFITDSKKSDAWMIFATSQSLTSERCKEEYYYALGRALETRGSEFPLIALTPSTIAKELIPPGIKSRLYVNLEDASWAERIVAAVERRPLSISRSPIQPYHWAAHQVSGGRTVFEFRPRAGVWSPVCAAIPIEEKDAVSLLLLVEPAGMPTGSGMRVPLFDGPSQDGRWWISAIQAQATPTMSLFVWCHQVPTRIKFGQPDGGPEFAITRN